MVEFRCQYIGLAEVSFKDGNSRTVLDVRSIDGDGMRFFPTDAAMPDVQKLADVPMGTALDLVCDVTARDGMPRLRLVGVKIVGAKVASG